MSTIKAVLTKTNNQLEEAGFPAARQESLAIFECVLGKTSAQLISSTTEKVTPIQLQEINKILARRLKHEPLQYILGKVSFLGKEYYCDHRALIPRPETELLVEKAIAYIKKFELEKGRFLDMGTGGGVIAITLKYIFPSAQVFASDCSLEALGLARENASRHNREITFIASDLLENISDRFSVIIANLPYVPEKVWLESAPEVRRFEPAGAIRAGSDGLRHIRPLMRQLPSFLEARSLVALEIWPSQTNALRQLAKRLPDHTLRFDNDLSNQTRFAFFLPNCR